MIFKSPVLRRDVFIIAILLFASGCASVPPTPINSNFNYNYNPIPVNYPKVIQHQTAPTSSWPPIASSMASVQFGSQDIFPPQSSASFLPAPSTLSPIPIKKEEIKPEIIRQPEIIKKKEPEKELEKPKPAIYRETHATTRNNRPQSNFLSRFENINWGDAPKPEMNQIEENQAALESGVAAYTIDRDDAPAFGLKPGMIIYYFKMNRFNKVEMIWEPDQPEYAILENNVLSTFGAPLEAEVLGSRRWIDPQAHLTVQFSDANAIKAPGAGHLMSLLIEHTE